MNNSVMISENEEQKQDANIIVDMSIFAVDFTKGLKKFWYIIVAFSVLFGCLFGYLNYSRYVPMYSSSVSFSVEAVSPTTGGSLAYYYDNSYASQLSKTFPYIINTSMMTNALKEELSKSYINGTVTAEAVMSDSNIFKVTVESNSAQDAYDIVNAIINVYPDVAIFVIGNVSLNILIKPTLPEVPYNDNGFLRTGAIMAVVGTLVGFSVIAVYAFFRNTVRKKDDFKSKLNQKCFVEIPFVVFYRKTNDSKLKNRLVRITDKHPTYKESFRLLRKRLMRNLKHGESVIGIGAAAVGEGKTTVAFNLAHAIAISGKKVACVDMDLRKRSLQIYLDSADKKGYSDLFAEKNDDYASVANQQEENLDVYLVGNSPTDFLSEEYEKFISHLKSVYDCVIVNLAAGNDISSCVAGANLCDCTMLVVRQDTTSIEKIRKTLEAMSFSSARILGFAFNCVQDGFSGYGSYYYGGKYGYGKYGSYGRYGYGKYGYGKYGYGYGKEKGYGYGYGYGYGEDDDDGGKRKKRKKNSSSASDDINSVSDYDIPDKSL